MATIVGFTSIKFTDDELRRYITAIEEATIESLNLPPQLKNVTILHVPETNLSVKPNPSINFWAYTAPGKPIEAKRAFVRAIQDVTDKFFEGKPQVRTVVIIKEHADENVGVVGVLRADTKK